MKGRIDVYVTRRTSELSIHKNNINFIYYGPLTSPTILDSKPTRLGPGKKRNRKIYNFLFMLLPLFICPRRNKTNEKNFPRRWWTHNTLSDLKVLKSCVMFCSMISVFKRQKNVLCDFYCGVCFHRCFWWGSFVSWVTMKIVNCLGVFYDSMALIMDAIPSKNHQWELTFISVKSASIILLQNIRIIPTKSWNDVTTVVFNLHGFKAHSVPTRHKITQTRAEKNRARLAWPRLRARVSFGCDTV